MSRQRIPDPDMTSVFSGAIARTLERVNCVKIGRIETFDPGEQKAEITIQSKFERRGTGQLLDYPLLVDVPVFVLQGGGAYLEMPIAAGDACLVMFNDSNIDTWWTTGNVTPPATRRQHSLADGMAVVGVNPQGSGVGLAGDGKARLVNADDSIAVGDGYVDINGDSKRFVTYAELDTALQGLVMALNTHTHPTAATGPPSPPTVALSLDISSAESQKARTG